MPGVACRFALPLRCCQTVTGADLHAILMLAVIPLGVALVARYCVLPGSFEGWVLAFLRGVLSFVVLMFVVMASQISIRMCGPVSSFQWLLPACFAFVSAGTGRTWKIQGRLVLLFSFIAAALNYQFDSLLAQRERYAGMVMGEAVIMCDKPVEVVPLWHSPFTEVYGLKSAPPKRPVSVETEQ